MDGYVDFLLLGNSSEIDTAISLVLIDMSCPYLSNEGNIH